MSRVPKSTVSQSDWTKSDPQPSPEVVHLHLERMVDQLSSQFPKAASMLGEAGADILALTCFPVAHWKQVWANSNRSVVPRPVGAVLADSTTSGRTVGAT